MADKELRVNLEVLARSYGIDDLTWAQIEFEYPVGGDPIPVRLILTGNR